MPPRMDLDHMEIATLYQAGATLTELAQKHDCSAQPIRRALRHAGVELRLGGTKLGAVSPRRLFTDEQEREVVRLYQEDRLSSAAIGRYFGVSTPTVLGALRRQGIGAIRRRKVDDETLRAVAQRYAEGEKLAVLEREVGYGKGGLREAFVRLGIPLRPPGKRPVTLDDPRFQAVLAAVESGETLTSATRGAGISAHTASLLLREAGYELPSRGPRCAQWKGGRQVSEGYVRVWVDPTDPMTSMRRFDGFVLEHRLVMARALGRPLERNETVHHINGDTLDNRVENLQLRSGNHGNGRVSVCRSCGSHDIAFEEI